MRANQRKALIFGLTFLPVFVVCVLLFTQVMPLYRSAVIGVANVVTGVLTPPTKVEVTPQGKLHAFSLQADGSRTTVGVWETFVNYLLFLNLALLPALLVATPAPWRDRLRLLLVGLAILFVAHVLCLIGLVRETQSLAAQPGVFHRLWLLRVIYLSGQIFAAVIWALLTWRYWFPKTSAPNN